jgi:hypothetical protein
MVDVREFESLLTKRRSYLSLSFRERSDNHRLWQAIQRYKEGDVSALDEWKG